MAGFTWARIARRLRALGPLAGTLAVVVGAVLLLGPGGVGSGAGARAGSSGASANANGSGQAGVAHAPLRIARADAHAEYVEQGKDVEVNLALTQTQNDCQAPLNGGVCLRYSVVIDEQAALVGYGVIPATDVTVSAGAITLRVDTAKTPGFRRVAGPDALIVATWKSTVPAAAVGVLQRANAQGTIGAYALLPSAAASGASSGAGASVIASMLLR